MKALIEFLKKSAQSRRASGPRPRRRITLLGPDRDSAVAVIHRVFGCTGRDSIPLQTDDRWKEKLERPPALPDDAPDDALRLSVLHLSPRRLGRPVPWELCVPATLNLREGAKNTWRSQSDVLVVCWPSRLIGAAEEPLAEIAMRLSGTIGKARALGRLRRVAFVIYDTPADAGPRHPSQIRMDVAPDAPPHSSLRAALERAESQPGDPLADPGWRKFLSTGLQGDRLLGDLVRRAGQAVGRGCPIFFVGERPLPDGLLPLVEWIYDDRDAVRPAAGRPARLLVVAAAAVCAIALAGLFALPGPTRPNLPLSELGAAGLEREVSKRLAEYRRWFGVPEALAAGTSRPDLVRADALLQRYREIARRGETLRKFVADAVSGASALGDPDRFARARLLRNRIALELRDWDAYRASHPELQLRAEWLQPWSAAITQAIVHSAMLGATRRQGGFDGFRLSSPQDASLLQRLSSLGGSQEASAVAALTQTGSADAFYRRLDAARRAANAALAASFRDAATSAPRLRVDSLRFESDGAYRLSWVDLHRAFGRDTALFREFVTGTADHLSRIGGEASRRPEPMQILFQASIGSAWHVDVRAATMEEYVPALWVAGDGCVVQIEQAHRDMQLRLSLNAGSRVHVLAGDAASGTCSTTDRTSFRLERFEGDVIFPSGRRLHYRVIGGWPGPQEVPS